MSAVQHFTVRLYERGWPGPVFDYGHPFVVRWVDTISRKIEKDVAGRLSDTDTQAAWESNDCGDAVTCLCGKNKIGKGGFEGYGFWGFTRGYRK